MLDRAWGWRVCLLVSRVANVADNPGYLQGTALDDVLTGTDLNESIEGLLGNDRMYGAGGVDQLWGAGGDDLYDGGNGFDYAQFFKANIGIRVDLAIVGPQDTGEGRDTFVSIEGVLGSDYNDVFKGDDARNELQGAAGADFIDGRGGDDFLVGGDGVDEIHGGDGADNILGGAGNDRLFGDDGADMFWADTGDDVVDGGAGVDTITFSGARSGVALDLAVTGKQEIRFLQNLRITGVENVYGTAFGDNIAGDAADNSIVGEGGNDFIDGRGGYDTASYSGAASEFVVSWTVDGWRIADQKPGRGGVDMVKNVEWLQFGDGAGRALGDGMSQIVASVLRLSGQTGAEISAGLSNRLASSALTPAGALAELIKSAGATTSVASLSYEFFTGKVPSEAGMDYLVSPQGENGANLNSAYYQTFNLENRYINFAVNLGKFGEGKAAFAAKYDGLSFVEATREAYKTIFGAAPTDAKIHAMIDPRADYFAFYGGDGANGIGTKAAMVGWLLAEAQKADLGVMVRSNDAWLADLASTSATPFGVNILDPAKGYYSADFIFGG